MLKSAKILIITFIINTILFGAYKNSSEAENIVNEWFRSNQLAKGIDKTINKIETKSYNGKEVLHIINIEHMQVIL